MSDYLKSTNFATKDALPSGNAGKIVKGTEIDNEFNAIADAVESKADLLNPVFSGLLTTDTLTTGGATNVGGTLAVTGALSAADDVQFTGTGRMLVPKGTTAQRPTSPTAGSIRFNTTLGFLENYNGTEWRLVSPDPTPAQVSDQLNTSTGYFQVPVGTISQRPASPAEGLIRYNSESDIYEGYINSAWHKFITVNQANYTVEYLVVAGGGGGSIGGGGAGGFLAGSTSLLSGTTYNIIVGAGGAGGAYTVNGVNGTNSGIGSILTAIGGGGGGSGRSGNSGGSGGGGHSYFSPPSAGGTGTAGQGNDGGSSTFANSGGAGGGGAGAAGGGVGSYDGSYGGVGIQSTITGASVYYAGGGGGGGAGGSDGAGIGGLGGGGTGTGVGGTPGPGQANTGGGGGGGNGGYYAGGSGVVIIKIPTISYTGNYTGSPVINVIGGNTIMKFNSSGSYTA